MKADRYSHISGHGYRVHAWTASIFQSVATRCSLAERNIHNRCNLLGVVFCPFYRFMLPVVAFCERVAVAASAAARSAPICSSLQ